MVSKFDLKPVKVDQHGHQVGGGQFVQNEINQANIAQANRVTAFAETGRLSSSGGASRVSEYQAVPAFVDEDVATGTIGSTKATLDASLALVNDGLDALIADANTLAAALGIAGVTFGGGGTAASPIAAITDSGTALVTSATAAIMNPIRDQINTNMHVAGAQVNKVMRALRLPPVAIETSPMRQPPPDTYGAGSTGENPPPPATVGGGGSGLAFGSESPFTDPTPAITEDSGTHASPGISKTNLDAALTTWRDNVETLATRLAVATNTVVALTDNSTGTAAAGIASVAAFPADSADMTTSLASKATTDAEMVDIRNAVASLYGKANELAAGLGSPVRAYDGLGTVSDTLAAIGAVTPATTGAQQTDMEAWRTEVEQAFDALAEHVNVIAEQVDVVQLTRLVVTASFPFDNPVNPLQEKSGFNATTQAQSRFLTSRLDPAPGAAIPVDSGTAADPGQQDADVDSRFATAADNLATLAAKINEVRTALAAPLVKLV